jgi:hypothetical protein
MYLTRRNAAILDLNVRWSRLFNHDFLTFCRCSVKAVLAVQRYHICIKLKVTSHCRPYPRSKFHSLTANDGAYTACLMYVQKKKSVGSKKMLSR